MRELEVIWTGVAEALEKFIFENINSKPQDIAAMSILEAQVPPVQTGMITLSDELGFDVIQVSWKDGQCKIVLSDANYLHNLLIFPHQALARLNKELRPYTDVVGDKVEASIYDLSKKWVKYSLAHLYMLLDEGDIIFSE